jgi:hypothetical protein
LQDFKQIYEFVNGFIPDLQSKFNCLTVLFTNVGTVKLLQQAISKAATTDKLSCFTTHLIEHVKTHKECLLVDPLNADMRLRTVDVIKASVPLETRGGSSFRFYISRLCRMQLVYAPLV